jgi:NADH:ubiquinone oxidoreductase subunit 4 (subunit M)
MISLTEFLAVLALAASVLSITLSIGRVGAPYVRRCFGLFAPLAMSAFFAAFIDPTAPDKITVLVPGWLQVSQIAAYCGLLFNFIYCVVFVAFGERVFLTSSAGHWSLIQTLVSLSLLSDNMELFGLFITAALIAHLKVSQSDVYQVSRRHDRFILVSFSSILVVVSAMIFFEILGAFYGIDTFSRLAESSATLPRYLKILGSVFMMQVLGAFPFHFWVKPLFGAPARYGLAVITRLNIGFVVWSKLHPMIFSGDPLLDSLLVYGCGANLLYAAFLLFGERRMSQIVSALYLFHVPLLILAVKSSGGGDLWNVVFDFANITVAMSGLLVILGMLRDRLGAENLDRASGLGIAYPFLGISFLVCVLSLVGFPGTLGFISSEVMLHHFAESTWPVAICFIITLALNGYSSFRIFGESFYGDPAQSFRKIFQPLRREKLALALILLFLFASGLGPNLFVRQGH